MLMGEGVYCLVSTVEWVLVPAWPFWGPDTQPSWLVEALRDSTTIWQAKTAVLLVT